MALSYASSALISVSSAFRTVTSQKCAMFLVGQLTARAQDINLVFPKRHVILGQNLHEGLGTVRNKYRRGFDRALGDDDLYKRFALLVRKSKNDGFEVAAIMFNEIGSQYQPDLDAAQDAAVHLVVDDAVVEQIRAMPLNKDFM